MRAIPGTSLFLFAIFCVVFQLAMSVNMIMAGTQEQEKAYQMMTEARKKALENPTHKNVYKYWIYREGWLYESGNTLEWSEDREIFDLLCLKYKDGVRSERYGAAGDWLDMLCDMFHYKYIEDNAPSISEYLVDDFLKTASKQAILLLGKLKSTNVTLLKELLAKKGPYNLAYMNAALARCGDKEAEYWLLQYVHKGIRYPSTFNSPGDKQLHLAYACANTEQIRRYMAENLRTRECFEERYQDSTTYYSYFSLGILYRNALIYMLRDVNKFPDPKYRDTETTSNDMRIIEKYCEKNYGIIYTQPPLRDPMTPIKTMICSDN